MIIKLYLDSSCLVFNALNIGFSIQKICIVVPGIFAKETKLPLEILI